ncbi:hypothetical protein E2562_014463 [Oryza meyeriana var. granulata]|uniref:Uncharacterized protein n=1 Tax=Oryza meyeriana var. granulata TaxID=110450 RepID=A0A6G1CQX3_9ORYZ|nr:hypothetical protein E2562_014463 [Oryza meyeriana var. granulata]
MDLANMGKEIEKETAARGGGRRLPPGFGGGGAHLAQGIEVPAVEGSGELAAGVLVDVAKTAMWLRTASVARTDDSEQLEATCGGGAMGNRC